MQKQVIIMGAGGHGRVLRDMVERSGDICLGFLDDRETGAEILGKTADCIRFAEAEFIIGIGDNAVREKIAKAYPHLSWYTAIDPSAVISPSAKIGKGTCMMPGAVLNAGATVGDHVIINTHAVVEHDVEIENYVHVSPGAVLLGGAKIGEGSHIGGGAVIRNYISVSGSCTVGMGAVVTENIEKPGVYVGVPARKIR